MNVVSLRLPETAGGDVTVFMEDCTTRPGASGDIGPRLDDLAQGLNRLSQGYLDRRYGQMGREARRIGEIAGDLRLNRVARVAATVCLLSRRDDPTALAANVARLIRLGENALTEIWSIQDQRC